MKKHLKTLSWSVLASCLALFALAAVSACDSGSDAKLDGSVKDASASPQGDGAVSADAALGADAAMAGDSGASHTMRSVMVTADKGGELESADGNIALTFPAGAVKSDTMVSVREAAEGEIVSGLAGALGKVYVFEPDGTTFDKPVELTIPVDRATLDAAAKKAFPDYAGGDGEAYVVALVSESSGVLEPAENQSMDVWSDPDQVTVRGEIHHFTAQALLPGDVVLTFRIDNADDKGSGVFVRQVGAAGSGYVSYEAKKDPAASQQFGVTFNVTDPTEASLATTGKRVALGPQGLLWETRAECLDVGKGDLIAVVTVAIDVSTTANLSGILSDVALREKYDCRAAPAPSCTPTAPKPELAPVISTLSGIDACRSTKFFFDAQNASTGTACMTLNGATVEIQCSGSYCQGVVPADATVGAGKLTLTTLAGSDESAETVNVTAGVLPKVTGFAATNFTPGSTVTVTGSGFVDDSTQLTFSNDATPPWVASLTRVSDTEATFVIPQGTPAETFTMIYITSDACGTDTDPNPVELTVASGG